MNITLEKDGKQVSYKTGTAYYLLLTFIPWVGPTIFIAMTIIRKQFRGIFVNQLLLAIIFTFISSVVYATGSESLLKVASLAISVLYIIIFVMYALKANLYSVKQRLKEGYTIVGKKDADTKAFLAQVDATKVPFWQILRF